MYAIHLWWWSYRETRPEADGGPPRRAAPDAEFSASDSQRLGVSEFRSFGVSGLRANGSGAEIGARVRLNTIRVSADSDDHGPATDDYRYIQIIILLYH